jgi:hypothetical protein
VAAAAAGAFAQSPRGTQWGLGFMAWERDAGGDSGEGSEGVTDAIAAGGDAARPAALFGHSGAGGSLAFFDPRSRAGVAVTVNQLSGDKAATSAILAFLSAELGVSRVSGF